MKISYLTALASCAAVVLSQPLEKRVLVWETVFEEVIQTVDVTTTLYDNAPSVTPKVNLAVNEPAPEPTSAPEVIAPKPSQTSTRTSRHKHRHSHTKKVSVTPLPPVIESVTPVVAPEATSTPAVQVPAPVLPQAQYEYSFDAQTQTPSPSVTPVPAPVYSYSIDPQTKSAAPAPSVTPLPPPPPPPVVQNPPPAPVAKYSPPSASSGGACGTVGGQCVGDITFYETGLGACGWTNDGNSEDVFALAHDMMGVQSNGNPFCGRMATITVGDKTITAKLVDKCMGCVGQSIDLSYHAIDQLMDRDVGRMSGIKWHFNN